MGKRVAILSQRRDSWHVTALLTALAERGCTADVGAISDLAATVAGPDARHRPAGARGDVGCGNLGLHGYDAILVRTLPAGSLEQVIFRMDALQRLERTGVRVVNPARALERSVDKYYTSTLLAEAGIPTPATVVVQTFAAAMAAAADLGGDVVAKPLFGSEGNGIVRLSDRDTAYRVFRAWELCGAVYYLQEFVPHGKRDVRAFVVGDRVLAAMERVGDGWKTNFAQGARVRPLHLPASWAELAVAAARAVGTAYAGVDLLPAADGRCLVHEVNGIPGWRGLQEATGVDVAGAIARLVLEGAV